MHLEKVISGKKKISNFCVQDSTLKIELHEVLSRR
jgi:hypothetical protein